MFVVLNGRYDGENTAYVPLPTMTYLIFVEDISLCSRVENHIFIIVFKLRIYPTNTSYGVLELQN
jgi:hypothetical protein